MARDVLLYSTSVPSPMCGSIFVSRPVLKCCRTPCAPLLGCLGPGSATNSNLWYNCKRWIHIWGGGGGGVQKERNAQVKKWRKQSCQCQESIFERRLAHHPKFSAPQIAESSVEQEACCHTVSPLVVMVASLSQCAKSWQPEPCIGHQLQWW